MSATYQGLITITDLTDNKACEIRGVNVFKYNENGEIPSASSSITLTAILSDNISGSNWQYKNALGNFVDFSPITISDTITINHTDDIFINDIATIKKLTSDESVFDIFTITKIRDGSPGDALINAVLSNDNQIIPCDGSGIPFESAFPVSSKITIYEGTEDITSKYSISATIQSDSGVPRLIGSISGSTFTATSWNASSQSYYTATVTFTCTRTGYSSINKVLTLSKITTGSSPNYYELTYDILATNKNISNIFNPSSVTLRANHINGELIEDYQGYLKLYRVKLDGTQETITTSNMSSDGVGGYKYTYTFSQTLDVNTKYLLAELYKTNGVGDYLDKQSIIVTSDGQTGSSPINIVLGNVADVIPCDVNGKLKTDLIINIPFTAYKGTSQISSTITKSNITTRPSNLTDGDITITSSTTSSSGNIQFTLYGGSELGNNSGEITLTFTCDGKQVPMKYGWSKSIQAPQGETGPQGIQGEKGEQGIPGIGIDGKTSYLHIAYATSADGSEGFSISESANKTYIGQYTDFVSTDSTDYTKYAWTKIKGEMSAEQIAQLNQASEDASQAKSDVANLEIGGRNLLTNPVYFRADGAYSNGITFNRTSNPSAWKIKGTATSEVNVSLIGFTNTSTPTDSTILLKEGQTYTESVKVEGSWSDSARIVVGISNSSGSWLSQVSLYPNTAKSHTFTATAEQYALRYWAVLIPSGESVDCTVYCKFEIGDKATDWIPAPEDVDAGINNAAKTATNYIHSDSTNGLVVNNNQTVGVGYDVQLKANGSDTGMNIRQDGNILASFLQNSVSLGKNSINSKVGMCGDKGGVSASFGYYIDSVTSNNAEMGSTLSFDFNETTFKNKVGQKTGFYEFTYTSAGGWRLFDPVNDTSYAVTLSQYGITMKTPTSSIKDHAGITINYVLDGSVKFYNADISNPVRKLELEMAENPSSSESDFANITIERQSGTYANGDGKEHSIITMMTLHEFANVATLQLFDDDISLNATHLYLTSSYGDGAIQLDGDTNINGNLVVQGDNLVSKIQAMFCAAYPETLTVKNGTFTDNGCSVTLVGNTLYLYFNAKSKAAISAGNITNQTMLTITFTDNRILTLYTTAGTAGASGPNSQMQFNASSSGGQHTITVVLAAIAQNIAKNAVVSTHISMPCVLNWDVY